MERRTNFLKGLDTKSLVSRLHQLEDELEQALLYEAEFKRLNAEYLTAYANDCRAVEDILAQLKPPESLGKLTVDQRKSWLTRERTDNGDVAAAIARQFDVAFQNENNHIKVEAILKRLEGIRTVLILKTAQLKFLTVAE